MKRLLVTLWQRQPALVTLALLLLINGLVHLALVAWLGPVRPPRGDLWRPVSFSLSLSMAAASIGAFLKELPVTDRAKRGFVLLLMLAMIADATIVTIQSWRGYDPRFPMNRQDPNERGWAMGMGLGALAITGLTAWYATHTFRWTMRHRPLLAMGLRWGIALFAGGLAAGYWIIANRGRWWGEAGNILLLHGLLVHGIQAVPLPAYLMERMEMPPAVARKRIGVLGVLYLLLGLFFTWHTALGRGPFDLLNASGLLVAAALAAYLVAVVPVFVESIPVFRGGGHADSRL